MHGTNNAAFVGSNLAAHSRAGQYAITVRLWQGWWVNVWIIPRTHLKVEGVCFELAALVHPQP